VDSHFTVHITNRWGEREEESTIGYKRNIPWLKLKQKTMKNGLELATQKYRSRQREEEVISKCIIVGSV